MKKILLFFSLCGILLSVTGCEYTWSIKYKVINQTDYDLIVESNGKTEQIIKPEESAIIHRVTTMDDSNGPGDFFSEDEKMLPFTLKVNEESVPDIIWKRKYWEFSSENYEIIYTLTVTNELIKSIKLE